MAKFLSFGFFEPHVLNCYVLKCGRHLYTSVVGGLEWFQLQSSNSTRVSRLRTYQQLNVQLRMTPGVEDMAVLLIRWHPLIESSWVAE